MVQEMEPSSATRVEVESAFLVKFQAAEVGRFCILRSAVEKQDLKRLRIAAHTLKSCLRYVADEQDVAVAAEIEANAMTPDQVSSQQLEQVEAIAGLWTERVRQLRGEQQTEVER